MRKVKLDWTTSYKKQKLNIGEEIVKIDVFDSSIARILKECFDSGDIVLEAGCVTGRFCFWLEKKGIQSIGIDIVTGIVEQATCYAKRNNFQASFIVGDVSRLPFRDNSFDGYISLGVIEHFRQIKDVVKTLYEAKRVVKNDGKIIITIPNIFVPLRNKILLKLSHGKRGFFHEFYTINKISKLVRALFPNFKIMVFDLWLPIYNIIDGILKGIGFTEESLSRIKLAFIKMPSISLLKYFLGYICLIAEKS